MNKMLVCPDDAYLSFFYCMILVLSFGKNGWHQATHRLKSKRIEID